MQQQHAGRRAKTGAGPAHPRVPILGRQLASYTAPRVAIKTKLGTMNMTPRGKSLGVKRAQLIAAFGVGVYSVAYLWASHCEGFQFAEQWLRSSAAVTRAVGTVSSVHLSPIHEFRYRFAGNDATFVGTLVASGSTGEISVSVAASEHDGVWTLKSAERNGHFLN